MLDWWQALTSLATTTLGAAIAVVAGRWQAQQSRKYQYEDFLRLESAGRDREVRQRADSKADEILAQLDELDVSLLRRILAFYVFEGEPDKLREARRLLDSIQRNARYLQAPLRLHVVDAVAVLRDVDPLGQQWLRERPQEVANAVVRETRDYIGRYLRNEKLPGEPSENMQQWLSALHAMEADLDRQMEKQAESSQRKESDKPYTIDPTLT